MHWTIGKQETIEQSHLTFEYIETLWLTKCISKMLMILVLQFQSRHRVGWCQDPRLPFPQVTIMSRDISITLNILTILVRIRFRVVVMMLNILVLIMSRYIVVVLNIFTILVKIMIMLRFSFSFWLCQYILFWFWIFWFPWSQIVAIINCISLGHPQKKIDSHNITHHLKCIENIKSWENKCIAYMMYKLSCPGMSAG